MSSGFPSNFTLAFSVFQVPFRAVRSPAASVDAASLPVAFSCWVQAAVDMTSAAAIAVQVSSLIRISPVISMRGMSVDDPAPLGGPVVIDRWARASEARPYCRLTESKYGSVAHQREHLAPAPLVRAEGAHHPAGRHHHPRRLDAASRHAGMARLDDDRDALRLEMLPDRVRHLRGQPLLHLEPPGKAVKHARELADPHHLVARQVSDRRPADDRGHVVLAMALERNVLQQHDLVIAADLVEGPAEVDRRVLLVAASIFLPRLGNTPRRIEQAFAVGIVARPADEGADRVAHLVRDFAFRRGLDEVAVLGLAMLERVHRPSSIAMSSATAAAWYLISGTAMISQ